MVHLAALLFVIILTIDFPQINSEILPASTHHHHPHPDSDLELHLVQVLARHGSRAPEHPYPNDPFKDELKYWPNGWGQLTEFGKEEQYRLGQFFRKRYGSFLNSKYSTKETYVLSSGYERTIQSAQIAMAGLYSTSAKPDLTQEKVRVKDFISSSVPIHSLPKKYGMMIQPNQQCPRLKQLFKEVLNTHPKVLESNERNKEVISGLAKNFGIQSNNFFLLGSAIGTLLIEDAHNMSIPAWGKDFIRSKSELEEGYFAFMVQTITEEQRRLGTGPILSELMKNMKNKISGDETRKFFYYSGHDITIANVMSTLGVFKIHYPNFSSCLIFELHFRKSTQEFILKLLYKYASGEDLRDIPIPNCSSGNSTDCQLEKFTEVIQPYIVEDLENECKLKSFTEAYIGITSLDAVLITVIAMLIILLLASQIYSYRNSKTEYSAVRASGM